MPAPGRRRYRSPAESCSAFGPCYLQAVTASPAPLLPAAFAAWFQSRGWEPHTHQLELLAHAHAGRSALLIAPTGGGKTLAGFLPSLVELAACGGAPRASRAGVHTLYISPLKALAVDVARNLEQPIAEMGLDVKVETRTGDTSASVRARQRRKLPQALVTLDNNTIPTEA